MADDKNSTLKILGTVGAVKLVSDIHDIKKHMEEKAEQERFDRQMAYWDKKTEEREKKEAEFEQQQKDKAAEEERAREKRLHDLQIVKQQNLGIYPEHLRVIEDLALARSLSLPEAAQVFRGKLEAQELFILMPEYSPQLDKMMDDLSKQFGLPENLVRECADETLQYGRKFSEELRRRGAEWQTEQTKRNQALQAKVAPTIEKRRKEIQEKQQSLEKNKRLGLNFFKVLEEVQRSRSNRNTLGTGILLLVVPLIVMMAVVMMAVMLDAPGDQAIAAGIASIIMTFIVMVLPYMIIWRPLSRRLHSNDCKKRGFDSIPELVARAFGNFGTVWGKSFSPGTIQSQLKTDDQIIRCIERGTSATPYILTSLTIDLKQIKSKDGDDLLVVAAKSGNVDTFLSLLELGFSMSEASKPDLLTQAAIAGSPLLVHFLMDHGAKIDSGLAWKLEIKTKDLQMEKTQAESAAMSSHTNAEGEVMTAKIRSKVGENSIGKLMESKKEVGRHRAEEAKHKRTVAQYEQTLSGLTEITELTEWVTKKAA